MVFWGILFYFLLVRPASVYEHVQITSEMPLLYQMIEEEGIRHPDVVFAQALHETTFEGEAFNSKIFLENNNPFGMKCAEFRETTCVGTNRGHAKFRTIRDAVKDYKLWQDKQLPRYESRYGVVDSQSDYVSFLEHQGYAEDPEYRKGVMRHLRRYHRVIARLAESSSLVDSN